jgi:outer membrane biosynthesis protein TonB
MRRSFIWSAALHFAVLLLAILGLPRLWETKHVTDTPMIVEMVKIDEQTASKDTPKPAEKKKPVKKTPPPPKAPPPPEPPPVAEAPSPDAEKVPVLKAAKPKKTPKKKEPPKKAEARPTPPRAIADARPRRRPLPPKDDFLQSVLRDVAPDERGEKVEKPDKKEPLPQPAEKVVQNRAPLDAVATMSEIDAIRHKIEQCWAIPAGARDADKLVVSIRVWVNPDGTVRDARILDQGRLGDAFFRTAAESALRAVRNPRCSPLPIPPKKYEQFKEMVLDFNPKEAAGS